MRKTLASHKSYTTLAVTVLALCVAPTFAGAATLFQDSFSYPNGNLTPNGGWYGHSSPGNKAIQVLAGAVIVQENAGSGEDINHPFTQQTATAVTYASARVKMPAGSVVGSANDYFFHFRPAAGDSNNFVSRTYIGPAVAGGDYTIGIAAGSLTTTPLAPWASGFVFGQTYRIVIAYDGNTGTSTMWVDPASQGSTSVSSTAVALVSRLLSSIALRQATPTGANYGVLVDDVRVGDSFADVTSPLNATPSTSEWGMMLLSAAMLIAGALFVVRRRATVA